MNAWPQNPFRRRRRVFAWITMLVVALGVKGRPAPWPQPGEPEGWGRPQGRRYGGALRPGSRWRE